MDLFTGRLSSTGGRRMCGNDEDSLPVFATETYCSLEPREIKLWHKHGQMFLSLAPDSKSGDTEALHFSNATVQMFAEGVLTMRASKRTPLNMENREMLKLKMFSRL
jgi:hypothetical protein